MFQNCISQVTNLKLLITSKNSETAFWSPLPLGFEIKRLSLAGKMNGINIKNPKNLKIIPYSLIQRVNDKSNKSKNMNFDKGVDLFFDFIMDNFEPELVIYSAKTVLSDHDIDIKPRKLAGKKEFKDRYWKYLFPAS